MKRKSKKQVAKRETTVAEVLPQKPGDPAVVAPAPPVRIGPDDDMPPPDLVCQEAEAEPYRRVVDEYLESIKVLREKKFTFREIAEWLSERGIPADYNSVWRAYTKHMSDVQAHEEDLADEEEETGIAR